MENEDDVFLDTEDALFGEVIEEEPTVLDRFGEKLLRDEETEEPSPLEDVEENGETQIKRIRTTVVKKPVSKWIIYLSEQRPLLAVEQPDLSVAQVTKVVAEKYKTLSEEEHARLDTLVQQQKDDYNAYLQETGGSASATHKTTKDRERESPAQLVIPLARVKRIMKIDAEVKTVSKDALAVTTKALELFVARFALKAASTAALRGGKTVQLNDVLHTIHSGYDFEFLQLDFPRPVMQKRSSQSGSGGNSGANAKKRLPVKSAVTHRESDRHSSAAHSKQSIKSFFAHSADKRKLDEGEDEDEENEEHEQTEDVQDEANLETIENQEEHEDATDDA